MTRYFCATVEGEAPDEMDRAEVRERLNENLPGWAGAYITRLDDPEELEGQP